ncbi:hypothetical protein BGV67_04505 [Burkholderia ubonensis]|nr:hypothetical protein BGV67_04505 [Burkholderia ubonensis]
MSHRLAFRAIVRRIGKKAINIPGAPADGLQTELDRSGKSAILDTLIQMRAGKPGFAFNLFAAQDRKRCTELLGHVTP